MIAKVKIAPISKWCEPMAQSLQHHPSGFAFPIGIEVFIETSSMRMARVMPCGGREWRVVALPDNVTPFDAETGETEIERTGWLCEHVLEMD